MVEQWTHKPLDVGSNPTLATFSFKRMDVGLLMDLVLERASSQILIDYLVPPSPFSGPLAI